jgi:prophage regulatory protein
VTISSYDALPDDAFVRMRELTQLVSYRRSAIYQKVKQRKFPPPVKLGAQAAGWRMRDVRAWLRDPTGWKPATGVTSTSQAA